MANGKRFKGPISDRELRQAKRLAGRRSGNGGLQKALGMTQRPTTAGQEVFGDVDVEGPIGPLSEAEAAFARENAGMRVGRQPNRPRGALSQKELEMAKRAAGY